jgi:hypothetical protein
MHHIVGDGWSVRPLVHDFGEAYAARLAGRAPQLAPLPVRYADFALWERESVARTLGSRLARWRPAVASCRGAALPVTVDAALTGRLKALAQETGGTLFMVLQAVLAVALTRAGAGEDIPIGTPVSGRGHTGLDDLVGHFVNLLVVRTGTSAAPPPRANCWPASAPPTAPLLPSPPAVPGRPRLRRRGAPAGGDAGGCSAGPTRQRCPWPTDLTTAPDTPLTAT